MFAESTAAPVVVSCISIYCSLRLAGPYVIDAICFVYTCRRLIDLF